MTDNDDNAGSADAQSPEAIGVHASGPAAIDFDAKPWEPSGIGSAMDDAAEALINDYAFGSDEGADHEPSEFERAMLHDAYAHVMSDETFFGPVRELMTQRTDLLEALLECRDAEMRRRENLKPGAPATTYTEARLARVNAAIARATGAA